MAPKTPFEHFEEIALRYETTMGGLSRELSRYIIRGSAGASIGTDSVVLDNACGPAIVTEEILFALPPSDTPPTIHAVDISPAMIGAARSKPALAAHADRIYLAVMPAEKLTFPDAIFSHSITNLGIFFFADAAQGASEIFRTLQPGGVAILTMFAAFPHLELVRRAQAAVRPNEPPFSIPVDPAWFETAHIENVLHVAGFENVTVGETIGHYGAPTAEGVADRLLSLFGAVSETWSAEEKGAFEKELRRIVPGALERCQRGVGVADEVEEVGIPMRTYVVVARK
jgi:ubiquinone/menaquinone biosynthesis C-methylase UbiE